MFFKIENQVRAELRFSNSWTGNGIKNQRRKICFERETLFFRASKCASL